MQIGIQNFDGRVALNIRAGDFATFARFMETVFDFLCNVNINSQRVSSRRRGRDLREAVILMAGVFVNLQAKLFDIEDDICNVFVNAGYCRELVKHAVNPN